MTLNFVMQFLQVIFWVQIINRHYGCHSARPPTLSLTLSDVVRASTWPASTWSWEGFATFIVSSHHLLAEASSLQSCHIAPHLPLSSDPLNSYPKQTFLLSAVYPNSVISGKKITRARTASSCKHLLLEFQQNIWKAEPWAIVKEGEQGLLGSPKSGQGCGSREAPLLPFYLCLGHLLVRPNEYLLHPPWSSSVGQTKAQTAPRH